MIGRFVQLVDLCGCQICDVGRFMQLAGTVGRFAQLEDVAVGKFAWLRDFYGWEICAVGRYVWFADL